MEYIGALESSGDTMLAAKTLARMKNMELEDYQKEIMDLYKEQYVSMEQLTKYWNGEIGYEQLEEIGNCP